MTIVPYMQGQLISKLAMSVTLGETTDWTTTNVNLWYTIRNNTTPKYLEYNYTPPEDGIAHLEAQLSFRHSTTDALIYMRIYENLTATTISVVSGWSASVSYFSSIVATGDYAFTAGVACEFKAQIYLITSGTLTLSRDVDKTKFIVMPFANP